MDAKVRIVRSSEGERHDGVPWIFKTTGSHTRGRFDFIVCDIEYFTGPPLHTHQDQEDSFFVLEGTLTIQVEDDVFDLGPGDFAMVPAGVAHTFDNVRDPRQAVKAINLMTFGGFDGYLADEARLRREPHDEAATQELAEKHGVGIVGPPLRITLGLV